jgi:hypothetical protein
MRGVSSLTLSGTGEFIMGTKVRSRSLANQETMSADLQDNSVCGRPSKVCNPK